MKLSHLLLIVILLGLFGLVVGKGAIYFSHKELVRRDCDQVVRHFNNRGEHYPTTIEAVDSIAQTKEGWSRSKFLLHDGVKVEEVAALLELKPDGTLAKLQ